MNAENHKEISSVWLESLKEEFPSPWLQSLKEGIIDFLENALVFLGLCWVIALCAWIVGIVGLKPMPAEFMLWAPFVLVGSWLLLICCLAPQMLLWLGGWALAIYALSEINLSQTTWAILVGFFMVACAISARGKKHD